MSKNIGERCVQCLQDTSFGSGKYVNRIPADNGLYDGYECSDCQSCECDVCLKPTLEYHNCNDTGKIYCDNCVPEDVRDDENTFSNF